MSLRMSDLAKRLFRRPAARRTDKVRLRVEGLEDRTVPTSLTVTRLADAHEGGASAAFRVARSGDTSRDVWVVLSPDGSATPGVDYTNLSNGLSYRLIPAGSSSIDVTAAPLDDLLTEGRERIRLWAAVLTPNGPGPWASATTAVIDNEAAPVAVVGTGTGLFGRYYVGKNFDEVKAARVDATVDFNWDQGGPVPGVGMDEFSVRWTGKVQAMHTGEHVFYTDTDDGVRLWVNGVLLVDKWQTQAPTEWSGTINLDAGQMYDIRMEYHENTLGASAELLWEGPFLAKEVIPTTQLYPNTATVGDLVWVDAGGNGRQDNVGQPNGEVGAVGVRVQIFEGAEGMAELVPAVTTSDTGNFSFAVPAGVQYRLQFGAGDGQYVFTQSLTGTADGDSDAIASGQPNAGMTVVLTAPAAGQSDLTRDAGLSARLDLDVNANGSLADAVDGAAGYLPGYEGAVSKVSTGTSFNAVESYKRQRMRLVLEGFGRDITPNISRIEFVIAEVSSHAGYASNKSDPSIQSPDSDADFSFHPDLDWLSAFNLDLNSVQSQGERPTGGRIEGTRTWINFYGKDYGGTARVEVRVYQMVGGVEVLNRMVPLQVVRDTDSDGVADKWELQMADRWTAQYGGKAFTTAQALFHFHPGIDDEARDPDGENRGRLVPQKDAGDAHATLEEYRGYILDGGGLDGQGLNGHAGGHIRLDPARKEVLLEVDRAAVLNNVPGGDLRVMLDGATKVFSNASRGAGIYVYYLIDQADLNLPEDTVDTYPEQLIKLEANRNPQLADDFLHVLLIDKGVSKAVATAEGVPSTTVPAINHGRSATHPVGSVPLAQRGIVFATSDATVFYNPTAFPETVEAYAGSLAHEITHQLIHVRNAAGFDKLEHTTNANPADPPGSDSDRTCLMFAPPSRANREFVTVQFFSMVQVQLSLTDSEGLVF